MRERCEKCILEANYRTPYGKVYCLKHIPYDREVAEGRLKVAEVKK